MADVAPRNYPPFYRRVGISFFRKRVHKVTGTEHVPRKGPYIVAVNHVGSFDPPMVLSVLNPIVNQIIYFVSEQYVVNVFGIRRAIEHLGMIPKIENRKSACLDVAREYLEKGCIVGIFPEGMRNDGPLMLRGHTGIARLALWTKAPVLPIGYIGPATWSIRQTLKNLFFGMKPKVEVHIGKPITFPDCYDLPITYELLREVTGRAIRAIAPLANKTYY